MEGGNNISGKGDRNKVTVVCRKKSQEKIKTRPFIKNIYSRFSFLIEHITVW